MKCEKQKQTNQRLSIGKEVTYLLFLNDDQRTGIEFSPQYLPSNGNVYVVKERQQQRKMMLLFAYTRNIQKLMRD